MNKCPLGFKKHEDCAWYRRGVRVIEATGEQVPFEECAVNIIADSLENMVNRSIGMQKEMNMVRNEVAATNGIFAMLMSGQKRINVKES